MRGLLYLIAAAAGLSNPVQSAANAALNKGLGQPLLAASVIYGVACVALALCALAAGYPARDFARLGALPWWAYVGGACNLVFVLAAATATRGIGSASFTVTSLVCAVLLSIVLDRFGLLGLPKHPLGWERVLGAGLAVAGVVLVNRG